MDKNLELIKKRKFNRDISWEEIKQVLKRIGNKISKYKYILIYILFLFIVLFTTAQVIKTKTNFYSEELTFRWDTVLSYDDIYHARRIYSENPDYDKIPATIVKHPFISALGQLVAKIENTFFDNTQKTDHYFHIVIFQILINIIGIFYLYKILKEQFKIKEKWRFLVLTIYELATVTLLGTLILDSFIISATLLIMSYYYLLKQKLVISSVLGIMVAGLCITNSIAFAIMAIFLLKRKRDIVKVGISCILGFLIVGLFLPYRDYLFNNFFSEAQNQAELFAKNPESMQIYLKRIFYYLCASPIFFINTMHTRPNGLDYVTFDLSAGILIIIATILFFVFIIYNVIKNIKDRNMLATLGLFVYNMILHAVVKFGLYEGTIYGLHILFAEILMFAFGFKIKNKIIRRVFICFSILLLLVQIRYNLNGMLNLLLLFKDWV